MAGAPDPNDLAQMLIAAWFIGVAVVPKPASKAFIKDWLPGSGCENFVVSADVTASKPR